MASRWQYDFPRVKAGLPWRNTTRVSITCQSRTVWTRPHPAISGTEASMQHDSTVYVGLDVHKESITVAYSIDMARWNC